ncbi:hypothetical protein Tco_0956186 [Tanacetum coccineum]|uniref:Uncharacterized protein n=1 Tax=Tanacetum coccineum TaxID=301880 RepID=A0ABQ5E9D7_9ASTR
MAHSDQLNTAYQSSNTVAEADFSHSISVFLSFLSPEPILLIVYPLFQLFKTLSLDESRSPKFNLFSDLEENSEEEVAKTMAETMEQYMSKTRADYGSGIARPKIDEKDHFELKGQFLKELRDNTFSGSDHEDANEHIEKVLEIVDLFYVPNITQDQTRSTETSDGLAAIQAQLNNLGREIKKVNEKVYAAQVGCELCKSGRSTGDWQF